ncbi:MAG: phytanoyl-CoA dioxygenase family protein [Pseudomonadota bacterium]
MTALPELKFHIEEKSGMDDLHFSPAVEKGIPVYDCAALADCLDMGDQRNALKTELAGILLNGAGAFVLKGAYADTSAIDAATQIFLDIIARENEANKNRADHFAAGGHNDRIWNSLEKLCAQSPETFARYHANRWLDLAAESWLGPAYQMTAQVNLVRPGGAAQEGHCDYHLGFMTRDQVAQYPAHIHATSAQLTLQGAIAHCDMPVESGTTKLLPHSQKWAHNYRDFREPNVRAFFEANCVQLPLAKGDLLFFSPGLMHGAGENRSADIDRMANLVQISSALGVAMETIDRTGMCKLLYPVLLAGDFSKAERDCAIANCAEGYAFPTSLDTDPPVGGLAPQTQQQLMRQGLDEGWTAEKFNAELDARNAKRRLARAAV